MIQYMLKRGSQELWARLARRSGAMPLSALRAAAGRARDVRHHLNEIIATAESRLALPAIGATTFMKPRAADWAWRPALWRVPLPEVGQVAVESQTLLGTEANIFHDCRVSELTLRQIRNTREADLAPFGLRMDVFRFDGSFLSLVLDLPDGAVRGISKRHLIRMNTIVEFERPLEIFARLNLRHGPNTEQIVRELPLAQEDVWVEFDLAYSQINEKRVEKMWLDLIFEGPQMNQVIIRDVTMSRAPRADL
ncbi:MAG: DUF6478 family protein [Pseudomonadota bacterium]